MSDVTREQALEAALRECRTDLMIASHNALDAAKTDPRWDGVFEKLDARVKQADAALAMTPAQGVDVEALLGALKSLEKTASRVSNLGAVTGSQWSDLTIAILNARLVISNTARALTPPAPAPWTPPEDKYVVWSHEHRAWWRANSAGYTTALTRAGVYSRDDAISISHRARDRWEQDRIPDELPIRVSDLPEWAIRILAPEASHDR